ncbi:hypothetical protein RJ640_017714 [Escallonia rubra]|uniref:Protein kinase domain-containing protein n=1 Tax=Escallonia rubra TaxID=112253 RepID=A0AA88RK31_9ASTE|nr:hypothetical protein RJ640_017714 [Escallonia rubra]
MDISIFASLVAILSLQSSVLCSTTSPSNITDYLSLLAFKSQLKVDPTNVLASNWTDESHFCDWFGVSCSKRRPRVTTLELNDLGLRGTLSPHIGNLSFLNVLSLRNNSFYGHLPDEIGRLHRLEDIVLAYNAFEGSIPASLSQCQRLLVISFEGNRFSGGIPKELSTLPLLNGLFLGGNELRGSIPPSLGNISTLVRLGLEFNNFSGTIPTELKHLSNIRGFNFLASNLSGPIPPEILNFSSLAQIWLSGNALSGDLPPTTGLWLPSLQKFMAEGNQLSGHIPSYLSNSSKLTQLVLRNNMFSGPIPSTLGQLQYLQTLLLDKNRLTGQIPREMGFMRSLNYLKLRNNKLSGTIPSTIGQMEMLQRLYLDGNEVEGSIPDEICLLKNLGEMDIHSNKLSGSIPGCIGSLSNLQVMSLSSNMLSSIPTGLWSLDNLLFLNLSSNSINGTLGPNLRTLKLLGSMDLSWNQISGIIPISIGAFESLTSLNLSANSFSGSIPESFGDLITLDSLDLSQNNLSGAIPKSLQALSHLTYLNLSSNKLAGEIPSGGPFANFTAQSFTGNLGLCGKPTLQVPPCTNHESKHSGGKSYLLKYVLPATVLVAAVALLLGLIKRRRQTHVERPHSTDLLRTVEHKIISYRDLQLATNNFSEGNLLGVGSFGSVYMGILLDGTSVAVKVLNLQNGGALKSFDAECRVLRAARHRNLVKIITTCSNKEFRALILQYMSHEYGHEGRVSKEGDMYSFGIMLLETFTRKKPTDEMFTEQLSLRQWVKASLPEVMAVVDIGLITSEDGGDITATDDNLLAIMELGLECSQDLPKERMNIKEVVLKLNKIKLQWVNSSLGKNTMEFVENSKRGNLLAMMVVGLGMLKGTARGENLHNKSSNCEAEQDQAAGILPGKLPGEMIGSCSSVL